MHITIRSTLENGCLRQRKVSRASTLARRNMYVQALPYKDFTFAEPHKLKREKVRGVIVYLSFLH